MYRHAHKVASADCMYTRFLPQAVPHLQRPKAHRLAKLQHYRDHSLAWKQSNPSVGLYNVAHTKSSESNQVDAGFWRRGEKGKENLFRNGPGNPPKTGVRRYLVLAGVVLFHEEKQINFLENYDLSRSGGYHCACALYCTRLIKCRPLTSIIILAKR